MSESNKNDYKATINLPQTDFPMQGKLPQREPERLAQWEEMGLAEKIREKRADAPDWCLHDGPPYANGDIHMGHALNKILKDLVVRYKSMTGHKTSLVPGWDCHGLPIEQKVLQKLGSKVRQMEPIQVRRKCHEYALKWVDVQREQFKRLGINGDWDHPYLTLDHDVEAGILSAFRDLVVRGLVRKGFRPVYWDPVYRTALAEAEIEHETHQSDSIYVKFPLNDAESVPGLAGLNGVSLVIWTTTPWTLPANLAVSLHPKYQYDVVACGGEHYVVAHELVDAFVEACSIEGAKTVGSVKPGDLEGKTCSHPLLPDKPSQVVLGEHVTLEAGTGCVHTAPGHGVDDFIIGVKYGLPVFVPVDEAGRFTADYPEMEGMNVFKANPMIVERLREQQLLLAHGTIEHQYPYSWRSHKPIIFRATEQWFMELEDADVRKRALEAIDNDVQWIPSWGHDRIYNMVEQRPNWCLSRQRSWGVPIPSIRSKTEGKSILHPGLIEKFIEVVAEKGTDAWFTEPLDAFWPDDFNYEPTGETQADQFEKEFDILDVWFDSGATHVAVCEQRDGLRSPASLYLEGSDQHRGWFQSSLLVSIGARDRAPYEAVLTHGFILDGQGLAMSKSKGNVISPQEIINQMGADGVRLWVISEDYRADMRLSKDILKRTGEAYRRIRNTFRFLIGNLSDFNMERDGVAIDQLEEFDRWILGQLYNLIQTVGRAYETYEFHKIYHSLHNFCTVQLSALYLDVVKDRLYCSAAEDATRRSAQTVCRILLDNLTRLIAPVLVFTSDEVWSHAGLGDEESVHLTDFPVADPTWQCGEIEAKWLDLMELRGDVSRALEESRRAKTIGHSLDAWVAITPRDEADVDFLAKNVALLKNLFIVSHVRIEPVSGPAPSRRIEIGRAEGEKCERCWMFDPQVGENQQNPGLCPRCLDVVKRIE